MKPCDNCFKTIARLLQHHVNLRINILFCERRGDDAHHGCSLEHIHRNENVAPEGKGLAHRFKIFDIQGNKEYVKEYMDICKSLSIGKSGKPDGIHRSQIIFPRTGRIIQNKKRKNFYYGENTRGSSKEEHSELIALDTMCTNSKLLKFDGDTESCYQEETYNAEWPKCNAFMESKKVISQEHYHTQNDTLSHTFVNSQIKFISTTMPRVAFATTSVMCIESRAVRAFVSV